MKCTQLAVFRVSPKGGHIKTQWIQEIRADGWIRTSHGSDIHPTMGAWIAPHNVITYIAPHFNYDYGGIKEGTLVQVWDHVAMIIRRRGAKYDVLIDGSSREVPWDAVRPVEDTCNETGE